MRVYFSHWANSIEEGREGGREREREREKGQSQGKGVGKDEDEARSSTFCRTVLRSTTSSYFFVLWNIIYENQYRIQKYRFDLPIIRHTLWLCVIVCV